MPDAARRKKKRSSERSKRHTESGEWQQFTSPDGHPYYYNTETKESRWELPSQKSEEGKTRRPKGSSKHIVLEQETVLIEEDKNLNEVPKPKKERKKRPESRKSVNDEPQAKRMPKNAMFQKLQASLEGRLGAINAPMMGRPPPMLHIKRQEEVEYSGGPVAAQEETKTQSLEEQYEAETAGMSAAERLRFLRKKRQENMMTKRDSIAGDDFMAEVANNMKKKEGVTPKLKEKERKESENVLSWKEQEQAEEERKRQQMQAEMEAKKQEEEATIEREQRREQERAEQLALEQKREEERKQRQDEETRRSQEKVDRKAKNQEKEGESNSEHDADRISKTDSSESDLPGRPSAADSGAMEADESSDMSSPERVKHRKRSSTRASKHGSSMHSIHHEPVTPVESVEDERVPAESDDGAAEVAAEKEQQRAREELRARKKREKELAAAKLNDSAASSSPRRTTVSGEEPRDHLAGSVEAEEETRAREKELRRERRRMAKMEAALAAQSLGENNDQEAGQRGQTQGGHSDQQQPPSSKGSNTGSFPVGDYPMNGQPPFSGGMYPPPYPYPMMPPPPPSPYGYYYPYMQPPPMSMPMYPPGMVPPGYQVVPQTPPSSTEGMVMPSALVPYGAESALANAYGYDMNFGGMYGQQPAPELSRCECCKGVGVGLVEKNGFCAHCNRLRLAFIVDSAQMRQRCSVCGGWGFRLLLANGMCEHCTRQTAQKSQRQIVTEAAARRRSSVATPATAIVPSAGPRRNSTGNSSKSNALDDIDWDKSSSDDSDWDD